MEFHDNLRKYMSMVAAKFDCIGKIRFETYTRKYIDVVWLDKNGNKRLALEIDGGHRKRSLKRLSEVVAENKIWIYYGNSNKLQEFIKQNDTNNNILLLNLGNIRKQLRRKKLII